MSFHPNDDILDLIREAKEEYEQEMKEMDTTLEDLRKKAENLKQESIPPTVMDIIEAFLLMLGQVGKNRVEIKQRRMEMLEFHLLQRNELQDIWDRLAGLGEHR